MSTQTSNPGAGNPGDSATQEPATAASPQQGAQPAREGGSPAPNVPVPQPPAPEPISGTWFKPDDPQILIQWTLKPPRTSPAASATEAGSAGPPCHATVRIYRLLFDATFPTLATTGPVVPFSLADPAVGPNPFLQGTFVLSQNPPTLEVVNLRFPGFQSKSITLYSPALSAPALPESGAPAEPSAGGVTPASGTSTASSAQADTAETTTEGTPEA